MATRVGKGLGSVGGDVPSELSPRYPLALQLLGYTGPEPELARYQQPVYNVGLLS